MLEEGISSSRQQIWNQGNVFERLCLAIFDFVITHKAHVFYKLVLGFFQDKFVEDDFPIS